MLRHVGQCETDIAIGHLSDSGDLRTPWDKNVRMDKTFECRVDKLFFTVFYNENTAEFWGIFDCGMWFLRAT